MTPRTQFLLPLLLLTGTVLPAQVVAPGPGPQVAFPRMKAYLGLTDAQVTQFAVNLNQYSQLVLQRQQRIYQVQSEVQQETAKSPLDPMALGVRYAEIEAICRNVKDEAVAAQNRNLAILTDAQKAKLKTLEDAYKLLPVITEAQSAGLLSPPSPYPYQGLIAAILTAPVLSGCQQPNAIYDPIDFRNTNSQVN